MILLSRKTEKHLHDERPKNVTSVTQPSFLSRALREVALMISQGIKSSWRTGECAAGNAEKRFPFENNSFSVERKERKEREPISGNYAAKRIIREYVREICMYIPHVHTVDVVSTVSASLI